MFRSPISHIRAPRLSGYDYSSAGAYFVTICAFRRMMLFGKGDGDVVALNAVGEAAAEGWSMLPRLFAQVYVDAFVVMPNHVHAIVVLPGAGGRDAALEPRQEPDRKTVEAALEPRRSKCRYMTTASPP